MLYRAPVGLFFFIFWAAKAPPLLFPMYTVNALQVLKMTRIESHEALKQRNELVVFQEGTAAFLSHQWLTKGHPDPEMKQMQVLQQALRLMLFTKGSVPLDFITESLVRSARPIPFKDFQREALWLWYDYFSVPQLEAYNGLEKEGQQAKAIASIPGYVARCRHFFALCPCIVSENQVLSTKSWTRRGWCILERACRELLHDSWILIQSSTSLELVATTFSSLSVGEGDFTFQEDRLHLAPVMQQILDTKLKLSRDLPTSRRHRNLSAVYFRGLQVDFQSLREVADFMQLNGFTRLDARDASGWCPSPGLF